MGQSISNNKAFHEYKVCYDSFIMIFSLLFIHRSNELFWYANPHPEVKIDSISSETRGIFTLYLFNFKIKNLVPFLYRRFNRYYIFWIFLHSSALLNL